MVEFRAFTNSDPPRLAEIWRAQGAHRALVQPITASILERTVLATPTFDRRGLILAVDGEHPLGFVHSTFGPTPDGKSLSREVGVTGVLMVGNSVDVTQIGSELLERSEAYLRDLGATRLASSGYFAGDPCYLGLYGGSESSGISDGDTRLNELYRARGYRELRRKIVLHRELANFRPIVDRRQLQNRRRLDVHLIDDPPARTWWEACTFGSFDRKRFEVQPVGGGAPYSSVTYWSMELFSTAWGVNAMGMVDLSVSASDRRGGVATYLLGESLRQLNHQGVGLVEAQVDATNVAALAVFQKLGFDAIEESIVYCKD